VLSRPPSPILLVDDQPANLLALEAVLQELGERLVRAQSGDEAVRKLRDEDFAAVLLDVHMPGMDGFETARLIRMQRRSRSTPIIFITADANDLSALEAYAIGAVDLLTKPLVPPVLKAKVAFFVELHRSKQELQAAERRAVQDRGFLTAVLEAVEDAVVACGADGVVSLVNRATREFHGHATQPVEKWVGRADLYQMDGKTRLLKEELPLQRAFAGEKVHNLEVVIAPKGGKARVVQASGEPLYDEAGRKLGAVVSMHDITARHEAQAASEAAAREKNRRREAEAAAELIRQSREQLRATEERLRLATDAARLGVWAWDLAADSMTWENERMHAVLGLSAQDEPVAGSRFAEEFLCPETAPAFKQAITRTTSTGRRLHFEGRVVRRNDHALRWVELTGILQSGDDGSPLRILGTAADITNRKEAEDELRKSEERYRTLFESMDEGFCVIEVLFDEARRPVDYRFLETNPAFGMHTGLAGAAGKRMRELVPNHDAYWFDAYGRVAVTGEPMRFENEATALGRWFDVYAARLGGPGSNKVSILFNDITERRRTQQNLQRLAAELAETDRRKTEFLATLAHELRNPLAPISNGLQLMRLASGDPQRQEKAREMMERQLRHLVRLVDDLLDMARISSGKVDLKKERVELGVVLNAAMESSMPLMTAAGHDLVLRVADHGLELIADPIRIGQVVSNLLNNAAKYTPGSGRVELAVRRDGGDAVITVTDTGTGIDGEALPQVFEMFTQVGRGRDRPQGGLGIGLALVRRLVELHDGTVTAESAGVGHGSTFTVRLPLASAAADPAPQAPATQEQPAAPLRVLVVDDNVDAAESLAALLDLAGHATRVAHDGDQALLTAHEFRPEIVFLDIGMPGKDGYEVARALRAIPETQQAVLVALTGWGAKEDRARSSHAGFDHHLTKPAGIAAVESLLSQMADARPSPSAGEPPLH
jgi:PAS domain S-box-containing protein